MKPNQNKKVYRQLGIVVGVGTTLFSICGPVLEAKVYAEPKTESSAKLLPTMPDANSLINYDKEFTSNTDSTILDETSVSSSESSVAESSASIESTEASQESSTTSTEGSTETTETGNESSSSEQSTDKPSSETSSTTSTNSTSSDSSSQSPSSSSTSKETNQSTSNSSTASNNSSSSTANVDSGSITYSKNQSTLEFIEEIGEDARKIGQDNNLYASVMIAQAILESSSGNSGLAQGPNYNLFGIKGSYNGNSVEMATLEDNGSGSMYTISAKFRKYPSYKESLEDYATLMTGGTTGMSTFYQGAWKSSTTSYKDATKYLTGRYATDTRYNEKLNGLIETYQLTKYDQKKTEEDKVKKSKETEEFIKTIAADTKDIAEKNDLYASVIIADAIIQSSSGNNTLAKSYNLFQTKGKYDNKSVEVETLKQSNGKTQLSKVDYKEYPSYKEGLTDYVSELKKDKDTFEEMTTSKKDSYKKVTAYLTAQKNNDLTYHKKLNALIATYDLTQYDKEVTVKDKKETTNSKKATNANIEIINKIGKTMIEKISEGIDKPTKYQVTQ